MTCRSYSVLCSSPHQGQLTVFQNAAHLHRLESHQSYVLIDYVQLLAGLLTSGVIMVSMSVCKCFPVMTHSAAVLLDLNELSLPGLPAHCLSKSRVSQGAYNQHPDWEWTFLDEHLTLTKSSIGHWSTQGQQCSERVRVGLLPST
jgi:hypothetical protein